MKYFFCYKNVRKSIRLASRKRFLKKLSTFYTFFVHKLWLCNFISRFKITIFAPNITVASQ